MLSQRKLSRFFDSLDKDGSGLLSRNEVRVLLGGNKLSDEQWNRIVKTSILKDKEELTKREFIQLVQ